MRRGWQGTTLLAVSAIARRGTPMREPAVAYLTGATRPGSGWLFRGEAAPLVVPALEPVRAGQSL